MSNEALKTRLDKVQVQVIETLDVVKELIRQIAELDNVIASLERAGNSQTQVSELKKIRNDLQTNIDSLIESIASLIREYQEIIQGSL